MRLYEFQPTLEPNGDGEAQVGGELDPDGPRQSPQTAAQRFADEYNRAAMGDKYDPMDED